MNTITDLVADATNRLPIVIVMREFSMRRMLSGKSKKREKKMKNEKQETIVYRCIYADCYNDAKPGSWYCKECEDDLLNELILKENQDY